MQPVAIFNLYNPQRDNIFFNNRFKKENFQIGRQLGQGKFGQVYIAKDIQSGLIVALKKISKYNLIRLKIEDYLQNEIKLQTYLRHVNIIQLYGFYYDEDNIYLIQEYATNGSLQQDIDRKIKYIESQALIYIKQILNALIFMHRNHVIYRDLKPENILLSLGVIKITDLGCSVYSYKQQRRTFCGTVDYMSPEIAQGQYYGQPIDMWSLGVLTYFILTGIQPFQQKTKNDTLMYIINNQKIEFPDFISIQAQDFINRLLIKDPQQRMNIEEAINHEWINQDINYYIKESWDMKITKEAMEIIN